MAYNQNIPLVTDYMVVSQPKLLSNFQTIFSVFTKNHVNLNASDPGKLQGMHTVLILREQTGDPATAIDQVALYVKSVSSSTMLFYRPSNNQTPIQLTYPSISTGLQSTNPDVFLPQQYSFMPGPFVIYFGTISINDGQIVTLLPATTLVFVSVIQKNAAAAGKQNAAATNIVGNQFTVRIPFNTQPQTISYIAIGV
jgi:hypothetical protein